MDAPLNLNRYGGARLDQQNFGETFTVSELLETLLGFLRRQFPIFVFVVTCSLALGLVYLFTAPAQFTAHAMLLIDSSKLRILEQQAPVDAPIDTAQVETQLEILKSEGVGLAVVKSLKLAEDPEFGAARPGVLGSIIGFFLSSGPPSETKLTRKALASFLGKRSITRVNRTYVLDISFTSLDPARSAEIANEIAEAYIVDQLEAKYSATKRASSWLQDRIKELRQQASDADRAVLDYKEKNKIVAVGSNPSGGSARLLGEQQLEELNTQLGAARAAAEETKARLQRISDVMQREVPDAAVADSLHSEVIIRLRNNYLDMAAKESIWSARYGSSHLAAVNLRTQMAELKRSIHDELGRIAESHKSDYEIAKSRVEGLERELQKLVANSQVINRDRLGLTDLESTAKVYHSIYDNFLQRYMEAIQQQSFPITEARVISVAAIPEQKSSPLLFPVLGIAGVLGILISFGGAVFREAVDRVFRTTRQVETILQTNCIAVLPLLGESLSTLREKKLAQDRMTSITTDAPMFAEVFGPDPGLSNSSVLTYSEQRLDAVRKSEARTSVGAKEKRVLSPNKSVMRQVVDEPLSAFAEAFRLIKVAADLKVGGRQVIGITSTVPREGKTTIASNLAQLIAHSGKHVMLVDGDLKNPSLTRGLTRNAQGGLLEVLNGQLSLNDAIYVDQQTSLNFLPAVVSGTILHSSEVLASQQFKNLISDLRKSYDYVIVDFPPIAPVVDVRATTQIVDSYIYVVEWGHTRVNLVQHQLEAAPSLHERLLGVVLNKADVRVLERYEAYYGRSYYKNHYGGQYTYSA